MTNRCLKKQTLELAINDSTPKPGSASFQPTSVVVAEPPRALNPGRYIIGPGHILRPYFIPRYGSIHGSNTFDAVVVRLEAKRKAEAKKDSAKVRDATK
jgi:hypothetical protein